LDGLEFFVHSFNSLAWPFRSKKRKAAGRAMPDGILDRNPAIKGQGSDGRPTFHR
jgi:hypothetical protein